nr:histidine kinase [uncultured Glaciecola sp.]
MRFLTGHARALLGFIFILLVVTRVITIQQTEVLPKYELALVESSGNVSQLPFKWRAEKGQLGTQKFVFNVQKASLSAGQNALYIPYYEQVLELSINGNSLDLFVALPGLYGSIERLSGYVILDSNWFDQERNKLEIDVQTGGFVFASLSKVYLGPADELAKAYHLQQFLHKDLKILLFGMQFLLFLFCTLSFYCRPQDQSSAWLALFCLLSCIIGAGVFIPRIPSLSYVLPYLFLLTPIIGISIFAFRRSILKQDMPRWTGVFIAFYFLIIGFSIWFVDIPINVLVIFVALPIACMFTVWVMLLYLRDLWRTDNPYDALIFVCSIMVVLAVVHDVTARISSYNSDLLFAPAGRSLLLVSLAFLLVKKQTNTSNTLDNASREAYRKLTLREQELGRLFEVQRLQSLKIVREQERKRITEDLHDGVAGHLTTILALIEMGDADNDNLSSIASSALTDLRMVIETLSLPDGELRSALAAFRERCVAPLHYLGVEIEWDFIDLPEIEYLDSEQVLSILRFIQEALTNSMRHGKAKRIEIYASVTVSDMAKISVINSGGEALGCYKEGHGIRNMRKRAESLRGQFNIDVLSDGAVVELLFPVSDANATVMV